MSADRPSSGAHETDNPPTAPPPSHDKPAPQPRDNRTTAEYNRDAMARPPIQRRRDNNQGTAQPDTSSKASNDAPSAGSGLAVDRTQGDTSAPGATPRGKRTPYDAVSDLEHNRAVMARPPMQRRDSTSPGNAAQRPDISSRPGASDDDGPTRNSGAGVGTSRSTERTGADLDQARATRWQPDWQGNSEFRGTSGQAAAPGPRHNLAVDSAANSEHAGQARADNAGTGQELIGPLGGTRKPTDGLAAVPESCASGSNVNRHGIRDNGTPHDQAAAASDQGKADALYRSPIGTLDAKLDQGVAPDSSDQTAPSDSIPTGDDTTPDALTPAADEPGTLSPDRPDSPAGARDSTGADRPADRDSAQRALGEEMAAERNSEINKQINETLDKVNPKFDRTQSAYRENCTGVVQANELRRRGLDVQAGPLEKALCRDEGGPGGRPLPVITDAWGGQFTPGTKADIEKAFAEPGSRGVLYVEWKPEFGGGAHVFNVENVGGQVRFVDGQPTPPVTDASHYFDVGHNTRYVRLDNRPTPPEAATRPYLEP